MSQHHDLQQRKERLLAKFSEIRDGVVNGTFDVAILCGELEEFALGLFEYLNVLTSSITQFVHDPYCDMDVRRQALELFAESDRVTQNLVDFIYEYKDGSTDEGHSDGFHSGLKSNLDDIESILSSNRIFSAPFPPSP